MKHALLKIAHDITRLAVWFVLSGLCSAGLMAAWRTQFDADSEASSVAFIVCMALGCVFAVVSFFLAKRVAGALVPVPVRRIQSRSTT